jgi:3-methyladenine DNA glycosylase AlkD
VAEHLLEVTSPVVPLEARDQFARHGVLSVVVREDGLEDFKEVISEMLLQEFAAASQVIRVVEEFVFARLKARAEALNCH